MKKTKKPRSLRAFMLIVICAAVLCCVAVILSIFLNNMSHVLMLSEHNHMQELSYVLRGSISMTLDNLHYNTRTWSSWDEPYYYARGENDPFIENNLLDGSMLTIYNVDFVFVKDLDGNDLYAGSRSASEGEARMELPEGMSEKISTIAEEVLKGHKSVREGSVPYYDAGFVVVNGESYMLCVMPILQSSEEGDPAGTFTFVARYGDAQLKALTRLERTNYVLSEYSPGDSALLSETEILERDLIAFYSLIPNSSGSRDAVLYFEHPRVIYTTGWALVMQTLTLLFLAIVIVMVTLYIIIRQRLLQPLLGLVYDVNKAGKKAMIDTTKYQRYRETNSLCLSINDLLHRLDMSYQAAEESKVSLNVLENILNGMDAYLYVSDPVTDEILFINDHMRDHFDLGKEPVGKICWKVLQSGFEQRCKFCPCYTLADDPDGLVVWEEHNTVTNRYYKNTDSLIDWIGGRKVHLQHSVDITDIKQAQFALDSRLEQQALMTSISRSFIMGADIDSLVLDTLREAGEFLNVEQILFYRFHEAAGKIECVSEWIHPEAGLPTRVGEITPLMQPMLSFIKGLRDSRELFISSNDPEMVKLMEPYRMHGNAFITTPIFLKNGVYGTLDFARPADGRDWTESEINFATFIPTLFSGVFERTGMEGQLRRLSSIVESSPQLILDITADGQLDYVNPSAWAITGHTEEELIEGGLSLIFDEQTVRGIKEKHIPLTLSLGTDNFELILIRKDGEKRIMSFSTFTTELGAENVCGIASDVTEIRELEAELIAAKDQAELGSRSKSEFLSRMSHEMRTPMNAIIGMTSIAKSSDDFVKKEYCLDRIDNASRHLLGVINDILDMSKIEANKFEISVTEFNFSRMLLNVYDVLNFRIEEKHQKFSAHVDPAIPALIIGDEQRLAQVITNLLTNAVKFTPERGSIRFGAKLLETDGDRIKLELEVVDSGIGISVEQQARLFHSFEQADGSIARKFGGTGLGLAISKRIVQLMGGDIWVESKPGEGSRFAFTLETIRGTGDSLETLKKRVDVGSLNIMAVDDSSEIREYFKFVMDEMQIQCDIASDGLEALALFKSTQKPYDMLFIDWKMPGMNGIELTKELRKQPGGNPIIIMISVAEWSDIEQEATHAGVNGFVPKPLFPSLIMDCINKHLGTVNQEQTEDVADDSDDFSFEGKTALLAEDVDINREIILTVLEDTMLTIECAENGREAIEMFEAEPGKYDIIFMDVHMPEIDGLEATRRIRALDVPEGKAIPIVAMTANVFREDIEKCLDAGMNDHIGKPIDFVELFTKLRKHIK